MILDLLFTFAAATALNTGAAGTYLVGNVVDLGALPVLKDIGIGEAVWCVISIDTTATSGGSATGDFKIVSDSTADLATSPTLHASTGPLAVATLIAGTVIKAIRLPSDSYERYLGLTQTTAVAAFTAGKINAFLTKDYAKWTSLPNALGA